MEVLTGVCAGLVAGFLLQYLTGTRPLINDIRRLRYDGFRPEQPIEPRPKTVPLPHVRED